MFLSIIMIICIKQHQFIKTLSNTEAQLKKALLIKKKRVHILAETSRRKVNQTIKFDQLIEYNMRNTFVEKSYTKCGGPKLVPNRFVKNQN